MNGNLIELFLIAEKEHRDISLILDSNLAYGLACVLEDEYDKCFDEECYPCEDILEGNDILSVSMYYNEDKDMFIYFIEGIINSDGKTLMCESDDFYIQEELLDCLDLDRLQGEKWSMEVTEIEDNEDDLDELLEEMTEDLLIMLSDEDNCPHCNIKNTIRMAYEIGYETALEDLED